MAMNPQTPDPEKVARIRAELRRDQDIRKKGYRDQALKLFPHVCASCRREFSGKRLTELTVHHKDHDHNNNPPDGHNWELLCIYCHDHEHEKYKMRGHASGLSSAKKDILPSVFKPFEGLDALFPKSETAPEDSETGQEPPKTQPS